jgi:hypothetical protein
VRVFHFLSSSAKKATDSETRRFSSYSLNLLAIEVDDLDIPEVNYDARVTIPSTDLANIIKDLNAIGEDAEISVRQDGIKFSVQGNDAAGQVWLKPESHVTVQDTDTTMVGRDTDDEGTALTRKRQVRSTAYMLIVRLIVRLIHANVISFTTEPTRLPTHMLRTAISTNTIWIPHKLFSSTCPPL